MIKIKYFLFLFLVAQVVGCSNYSEHEKLSVEATAKYLKEFTSMNICSVDRLVYKRKVGGYSASSEIEYRFCNKSNSQRVSAPHTTLVFNLEVKPKGLFIEVENWQYEQGMYDDFKRAYLNDSDGEINDILLVIKEDIKRRRDIAASNGKPNDFLEKLNFTFTQNDKQKLRERMTSHVCTDSSNCIQ